MYKRQGRSGAILAPIVIGTLVGMQLPLEQNFMAMAIPAAIAVVAVSLIRQKPLPSSSASHGATAPAEATA